MCTGHEGIAMTSMLSFAISFCLAHSDVITALVTDLAKLTEEHTASVGNPNATALLNAGVDMAAAKAIAEVSQRVHAAVSANNGSSGKSPANHG